ncbi:MAG: hypothetical protein HQL63_10960 [Magnetococcales bacterium]|nr:hypothetical protein [Magnetococcales bacterium]
MNDLETIRETISRGLDADLDRVEIRRLFLLVARDAEVRREMEEMAALEEALSVMALATERQMPASDLPARVIAALHTVPPAPLSGLRVALENGKRLLARCRELDAWQVPFGAGLATAVVAILVVAPFWGRVHSGENTRLVVHDLQFIDAQPRVSWTNQFIVPPGGETRFALRLSDDKPLRIQFQTAEASPVRVVHDAPGSVRGSANLFTVDGIGFATLRRPRTGDGVAIQNQGSVPLVVYLQGVGSDGTIFGHAPKDLRQSL